MAEKKYSVRGKIISELTKKDTFKIQSSKSKGVYTILYPEKKYCPFREGDEVYLICYKTEEESILRYHTDLDVKLGCDRKTFLSLLARAWPPGGFSLKKANTLADHVENILKAEQYNEYRSPCDLMSYFAEQSLHDNGETVNLLCSVKWKINGITRTVINAIDMKEMLEWWQANHDMRRLYCLGLTFDEIDKSAMRPYELYCEIIKNPYAIPSISLEKCRELDKRTERDSNVYDEDCGKIVRDLYYNNTRKYWSCTPRTWIEKRSGETLDKDMRKILQEEFRVVFDTVPVYPEEDKGKGSSKQTKKVMYLQNNYNDEKTVFDFIVDRVKSPPIAQLGDPIFYDEALDEYQRAAVSMAMKENICIICGPAGSGKTRTIRTLLQNLEMQGRRVVVTSFTGKAVIRARELNGIGENAATMHRILYGNGPQEFDDVIFEESSMNSMSLVAAFIRRFSNRNYRAIFIGDPNQLPPIDWGLVFASMIDSRSVPKVELKSIHRVLTKEGKKDGIIDNSTTICTWPKDVDYIPRTAENFQTILGGPDELFDLVRKAKREGRTPRDVTILSPTKSIKKSDGSKLEHLKIINITCQNIWNAGNPFVVGPDKRKWYVGDRVMVNKNMYDGIDIFNGQEGYIKNVTEEGIDVCFDVALVVPKEKEEEREEIELPECIEMEYLKEEELDDRYKKIYYNKIVTIPFCAEKKKKKGRTLRIHGGDDDIGSELSTNILDLSFALTIHKSQGSEWKEVNIIADSFMTPSGNFNNRNMYYTALTRASERVNMIGPISKLMTAIGLMLSQRENPLTSRLKHELDRLHDFVVRKIEEVDTGACEDVDDYDYW